MKQWWKRIVVLLAVVCVFWGTARNVMAEEELLLNKVPNKYYDVGSKVGIFELKSNTHSLKVGDIAEVQIWFDPEYATNNLGYDLKKIYDLAMELYYDKDVFQFKDISIKYEDNGAWREPVASTICDRILVEFPNGFDRNDCFMTVNFEVKKEVSSTVFYCTNISASDTDATYVSEDDEAEDGRLKAMSLTIEDATPSVPTQTPVFSLKDSDIQGNGEVTIPISIQSNDGFAALGLTINYDATLFDYKALEVDSNLKDKIALKDIYPTDGQIKAAFVAGQNITDVGAFLNLTLETKESAPIGTTSDVTITVTQVANYDEESLNGTGAVCTVTLAENTSDPGYVLGDVNNDGSIDLVDALCVLQYYNSVKELTDDEKTAADVDKNKTVDLVDALRIMKFYNGEISGF